MLAGSRPSARPRSRTSVLSRSLSGSTTRPRRIISWTSGTRLWRLDDVGALRAAGLDGVGVDGPLAEHGVADAERPRLALEDRDEGVADRLALLLRVGQPVEGGE